MILVWWWRCMRSRTTRSCSRIGYCAEHRSAETQDAGSTPALGVCTKHGPHVPCHRIQSQYCIRRIAPTFLLCTLFNAFSGIYNNILLCKFKLLRPNNTDSMCTNCKHSSFLYLDLFAYLYSYSSICTVICTVSGCRG
jgi:hypothetical protein